MIGTPLLAGLVGIAASGFLMLCSVLLPKWFVSSAVHELDEVRFGSRVLSERESTILGVLLHFIFSFFFGAAFGTCLNAGILALNLLSMVIYGAIMVLILGGVVLPLEGHGWFGWKEDHWILVDLIAMNALWALMFWAILSVLI
jgi:uncharacterized membrane protein YagU involved in acid resistance